MKTRLPLRLLALGLALLVLSALDGARGLGGSNTVVGVAGGPGSSCPASGIREHIPITVGKAYSFVAGSATTDAPNNWVGLIYATTDNFQDVFFQPRADGSVFKQSAAGTNIVDVATTLVRHVNLSGGHWYAEVEFTLNSATITGSGTQSGKTINRVALYCGTDAAMTSWNVDSLSGLVWKYGNNATGYDSLAWLYAAPEAPPAPTGVTIQNVTGTSLQIMWNPSATATGYKIHTSTTSGFAPSEGTLAATTSSTTQLLTGLSPSTTYYFKVVAYNGVGDSTPSDQVTTTTASPPAAPTGLTVSASGNGTTELTWNAAATATSYRVYVSYDGGANYDLFVSSQAGTTATISGLTNGWRVYWKVSAVSDAGEGSLSAAVSSLPRDTPNLAISQDPAGGLSLTWGIVESNVSAFHVNRSTANWSSPVTLGTPALYAFEDDTCADRTRYYYRVVAELTTGEYGPESLVKDALCPDVTGPGAVTGLGAEAYQTHIALSWTETAAVDFAAYRIYRDDILQAIILQNLWYDHNLTDSAFHTYAVRVEDTTGNEGPRASVTSALLPQTSSGGGGGDSAAATDGGTGGGSTAPFAAEAGSPLERAMSAADNARARVASLTENFERLSTLEWTLILVGILLLIVSFPKSSAVLGVQAPPGTAFLTLTASIAIFGGVWWFH